MKVFCAVFLMLFCVISVSAVPVPILMYHDFVPDDAVCGEFAVTQSRFSEHLAALCEAGYETVTFADLIAYADGEGSLPEKPVLLTADDGYTGVLTAAVPVLRAYGMGLSCAVIGSMAGEDGHFSLGDVSENSVEIVSHTFDLHREHTSGRGAGRGVCMASAEELAEDIERMKAFALPVFPMTAQVFVCPYGAYTDETEEIVRASGYRVTVTCDRGIAQITEGGNLFTLPRIGVYQNMSGADLLAAVGERST